MTYLFWSCVLCVQVPVAQRGFPNSQGIGTRSAMRFRLLLLVASALVLVMVNARSESYHRDVSLTQTLVQAEELVSTSSCCQLSSPRAGGATPRLASRAYDPLFDRADEPSGIAVTPDGSTLYLTAHKSHNVFVIDVDTRQVLDCVDPTEGGTIEILVEDIAITPDGRWAVITSSVGRQELQGSYTILDLIDNSIVNTVFFDNGASGQPQPLPDSNTVCIAGDGPPRVYFVDIPTLSTITTIDLHEPTIDLRTFVIGLSPDGNTLYAIGPYGVPDHCRLVSIDTATRTVDQVIEVAIPDVENLSDVVVSPDGTKLYVAHGIAQKVYVLDLLNNGEVLAEIDFDQVVQTIEFSVDGAVAYVGGFCPGGVYAVDTSTYSIMALINPPGSVISDAHALDMAPDGSLLFVAGADADGVFFIDVATSEVVTYINLNPIDVWPQQVALSNDGRWLYTAGVEYSHPGRVYVIDTEMRAVVEHIPIDSPLIASGTDPDFQGFGLSPDGTILYTHGCARSAANPGHLLSLVIDLDTKQVVDAIDLGLIQPDCGDKVVVSIDGDYVYYTQTAEERVVVASVASMQVITEIPLGFWPIDIGLSHDGTTAFVSGGEPRHVAVIDLATNAVIDVIDGTTQDPGWHGMGLAVAPDDSDVWWGAGGLIEIIDAATRTIVGSIELLPLFTAGDRGAATPFGVAYSPDGAKVFVANFDANHLMIFDASTRELLHKIPVGFSPTDIAVSLDSNEIYVLNSQSETISVIDVAAGMVVATISLRELGIPETASIFRVTSTGSVLTDGAFFGSDFRSASADVAEWVPVSEPVEPGDVLELDPNNPGHYRKAREQCSDLVAGVVSSAPGVILGSEPQTPDSGLPAPDRALLALIGIVPVKVTDEGGPIQPGDLLVSSSSPGHAMRWDPGSGKSCDLVGKALEAFDSSTGQIQVLLMR